ncbi:hypothetical protein [Streptomyces noursei]|uniref:hypothetical protein n=1 Tax=Streptomyces noursei TaxID=1971 RepID=UPI003822A463
MTSVDETAVQAGAGGEAPEGDSSPGIRESLRALRPNRQLAHEVYDGSLGLLRQGAAWLCQGGGVGGRLGGVAIGAYVLVWEAGHYPQIVMPAIAVGWTVAAVTIGHRTSSPPPPAKAAKGRARVSLRKGGGAGDVEEVLDDEEMPALDRDTVAALIRRVAEDRQGAHLAQLVETDELADLDQAELKAALLAWDLPVEAFKLRLNGRQRVREGVRVKHLPHPVGEAPAGPPPGPAPAAAGGPPAGPVEGAPGGPLEGAPDPSPPPAPGAFSGAGAGG